MEYTSQQELILKTNDQRVVVLACPGSGKTAVITQKIVRIVRQGVSLSKILSVTFTRKAAREMLERLEKEITVTKADRRNICTLHALGSRILSKYYDRVGLKCNYTFALQKEKEQCVKDILTNDISDTQDIISAFLDYVSARKNGFSLDRLESYNFPEEQFLKYNARMIENNLIDVDDLVYLPLQILSHYDAIRSIVSSWFSYVFVDEYQDVNKAQDDFIQLLISDSTSVMFVGDDDQSIYEFRGSNPNLILDKSNENSGFSVYYLTENFRSQKPIVELSKQILASLDTTARRNKQIISRKTDSVHKPVRRKPFAKKEDEISFVVEEIERLISESLVDPQEIAVLSRYSSKTLRPGQAPVHPELYEIGKRLRADGYPVASSTNITKSQKGAQTVHSLCTALLELTAEDLLPQHLNLFVSNIYVENNFKKVLTAIDQHYSTDFCNSTNFCEIMERLSRMSINLENAGMQKRLSRYLLHYSILLEERKKVHSGARPSEIILDLKLKMSQLNGDAFDAGMQEIYDYAYSFAKSYETRLLNSNDAICNYQEITHAIDAFLCLIEADTESGVRLTTVHQSKGLQFDVVFIVGLEVGNFPCNIEKLEGQYWDNEKRLFYVGVTRARELLYLTSTGIVAETTPPNLCDRTLIYNIPEAYFSESNESFEDVKFSVSDPISIRRIKEKEATIALLESDNIAASISLSEAKQHAQMLEEIIQKDCSLKESQGREIIKLNAQIAQLFTSRKSYSEHIAELEKSIDTQKTIEDNLRSTIKELEKSKKDTTEIQRQLALESSSRKSVEKQLAVLNTQYEQTVAENSSLQKELQAMSSQYNTSQNTVQCLLDEIRANVIRQSQKIATTEAAMDTVQRSILNLSDDILPDEKRTTLNSICRVFLQGSKYRNRIKQYVEGGLSCFTSLSTAAYNYKNGIISKSSYETTLRVHSYKTNMIPLIRSIISYYCDYMQGGNELNLSAFFKARMNPYSQDRKYLKLNETYDRRKRGERIFGRDVSILYEINAIASTSSHDKKHAQTDYQEAYLEIIKRFPDQPFDYQIEAFFSVFKVLSMSISDHEMLEYIEAFG